MDLESKSYIKSNQNKQKKNREREYMTPEEIVNKTHLV